MKLLRTDCFALLLALAVLMPGKSAGAEDATNSLRPIPSEARALATRAAQPFVEKGFRLRDGDWSVTLASKQPAFIQVTLLSGVGYLFVAASPGSGQLRITLYDGGGKPVSNLSPADTAPVPGIRTAAYLVPGASGTYFVGVELTGSENESPVECSLIYAYQ